MDVWEREVTKLTMHVSLGVKLNERRRPVPWGLSFMGDDGFGTLFKIHTHLSLNALI